MMIVLLPGMDGTGALFARFTASCPHEMTTQVIAFPPREALDYDALARRVRDALPRNGRWVLLGESFAGPLALRLAAAQPEGLAGVVLCASFLRAPPAARMGTAVARIVSRVSPPTWVLRWLLAGGDADLANDVRRALNGVAPDVIATRLRSIAAVDARADLAQTAVPVLALSATEDALLGGDAGERITTVQPDVRLVRIPAPHLLLQAAPMLAWEAITTFVQTLGSDARR